MGIREFVRWAGWLSPMIFGVMLAGCGHKAHDSTRATPEAFGLSAISAAAVASAAAKVEPAPSLATPPGQARPTATAWPIVRSGSRLLRRPFRWDPEIASEQAKSCQPFAATPYTATDAPSQAELAGLTGCDAEALYYGIGVPIDYERARKCAFMSPDPPHDAVMGGAEILMMIYANGKGVPRNFELALRFACVVAGAPAEINLRFSRLLAARARGLLDDPMDVCDDITSGYMSGYCAAHQERIARVPRHARERVATATMPRAELKALRLAADRFFETRETWEVDLTGTARAMFSIEERAKLEDDFVATLEHLQDPKFSPTKADSKLSERELSQLIAKLPPGVPDPTLGFVTSGGIRKTQKQWLHYRDALLQLIAQVRPAAELDAWRAFIIEARLQQLREAWREP